LQSVQNQRAVRREKAERDLSEAAAQLARAVALLEDAIGKRNAALESYLRCLESGVVDPHELSLHISHIATLVRRENEARAVIKPLERAQEFKRQAVIEATRDEKAITKLRDRHRIRFETAAARIEQTALDEMATMAFVRRCE
jgi:flagellar export protein FliJ